MFLGRCGSTQAYCASGCQSAFGTCSGSKLSSSIQRPSSSTSKISSSFGARTLSTTTRPSRALPTATQSVSTDARCGPSFGGRTCQGSRWGNCKTILYARIIFEYTLIICAISKAVVNTRTAGPQLVSILFRFRHAIHTDAIRLLQYEDVPEGIRTMQC